MIGLSRKNLFANRTNISISFNPYHQPCGTRLITGFLCEHGMRKMPRSQTADLPEPKHARRSGIILSGVLTKDLKKLVSRDVASLEMLFTRIKRHGYKMRLMVLKAQGSQATYVSFIRSSTWHPWLRTDPTIGVFIGA